MIIVFLLFIFLLNLSFICSNKNILSPGVLTSGIWIACFLLFWILQHNLPPLKHQFLLSISLWVSILCISSLLMQSLHFKKSIFQTPPSIFIRNTFFWISVATFPLLILFAIEAINSGVTGNWALDLRLAAIGQTNFTDQAFGGLYIIVWQVTYIIELFYFSRKNWWKVLILGFFVLSFGFLTMAKITFLEFFIKTVCILYFSKKINLKHILIGVIGIFFIFISLQVIRYNKEMDSDDKIGFLITYVVGNMSAYDTLEPASSNHCGENVFRFFYSLAYKTGLSDIEPVNTILKFIKKPLNTNTFTGMYPFFKDFGYVGVGIFACILGLMYGWIFKKAQQGNVLYILIYTIILPTIIMQYVAELFFTNFTLYLKQIIILIIPFLFSKYKLLRKN